MESCLLGELEPQLKLLSLNEFSAVAEKEDKRDQLIMQYQQALSILLKYSSATDFTEKALDKKQLPRLMICAAAHCGRHLWTTSETRGIAKRLLDNVLLRCGCASVTELLVGEPEPVVKQSPYLPLTDEDFVTDHLLPNKNFDDSHSQGEDKDNGVGLAVVSSGNGQGNDVALPSQRAELLFHLGILRHMFSIFKATLTKDIWQQYPTEQYALVWCLRSLKHPHLSSWIELFLPPILMFIDHHELQHKLLGLSCLTHLIRNVNAAELTWYNRAMVLYQAIHKFLYFNVVEIIISLHRCMLLLLPIVDGPPPVRVDAPCKPGKRDEVFSILLNSMDFESKLPQKRAYSNSIVGYIELLGIHCARHLKRLLSIIYQYLQFPDAGDEECRLNCVRALLAAMRNVWPRIPYHQSDITKSLVRLISDCCGKDGSLPKPKSPESRLISGVIKCLIMLQRCSPSLKLQELLGDCDHAGLRHCIQYSTTEQKT